MTPSAWLAVARALFIALGLPLGLGFAWWSGRQTGIAAGQAACAESKADQYRQQLDQSGAQIKAAQQTSTALFQRLDQHARADRATTQDLRDALAKTASERAACRFPADVMQQLSAARQRAEAAITGGLGAAVPAAGSAE